MNDGPGQDYFEEFYLTHSVTDILVGSAFAPERNFIHAQHDVPAADRYSAIFDDFVPVSVPGKRLLLDHVLLSPGFNSHTGVRRRPGTGAIEHAIYTGLVNGSGAKRVGPAERSSTGVGRPLDSRPAVRVAYLHAAFGV